MNEQRNNPLVETPQELIEETIRKVEIILEEKFPNYLSFGNGTYTITYGTTLVMIIVRPYTREETSIECTSYVVLGADITFDLMKFLLRKNAELHFGSFGLLFDDTVTFSHSITGTNLDPNELITTLDSVTTIADYYDEEIIKIAGGKTASDLISEDILNM